MKQKTTFGQTNQYNNKWSEIILDGPRTSRFKRDRYKKTYMKKNKRTNEGIPVNSRRYAIAWGVQNKVYYLKDLHTKCKDENAPSASYILKEWGGFVFYYRDLVKQGMEPRPAKTDAQKRKVINDATGRVIKKILIQEDYDLAKFCAAFDVKNKRHYNELRELNNNKLIMPYHITVVSRFGSWANFMCEIMKYNVDITLDKYVNESIKVGYWLRVKDCDKLKIPIRKVMNVLKPRFFNALCYRKKELLDEKKILPKTNGESKNEK